MGKERFPAGMHAVVIGPRGVDDPTFVATELSGHGFHDCPYCRELGAHPPAFVGLRADSVPELLGSGWIDGLLELIGPDGMVSFFHEEIDEEPFEEISMAAFLARIGYDL